MIETVVIDYLTEELDGIPVYMGEPNRADVKTWVRVEKTGSSESNHIYHATFAVQSYAPTFYEAAALNDSVKNVMYQIVALAEIASINLNSDYNFTDTSTKQPRYQAVFDIVHY